MSNKKQKYIKTDAIILKTIKQGEINRFFTFISPLLGIEKATAFGATKPTSRFCSVVQPFTNASLFLSRSNKTGFYKLDDATNVITLQLIKRDLNVYYLLNFFTEILLKCYFDSSENRSYYYLLKYSMEILQKEQDTKKAFLFFTSKFLILSGYNYTLTSCKKTNQIKEKYFFYPVEGGVFSEKFFNSTYFELSQRAAILWNEFLNKRYKELIETKLDLLLFKELFPIILFIIEEIFDYHLNSLKYLKDFGHLIKNFLKK